MAKKHTYRVSLPDGTEITRTTHRIYTHVVVFTYDPAKREAFDTSKEWVKNEARNHAYYAKIVQHGDGTGTAYGLPEVGEYDYKPAARAKAVADAVDFIAKYPTAADYSAKCLASRREYSARQIADGWMLAGWCGRLDLAQKVKTSDLADKTLILPVPPAA